MTARRSPGPTERSTPSTARSAPNATTTWEMLRIGSDMNDSTAVGWAKSRLGLIESCKAGVRFCPPRCQPRRPRASHENLHLLRVISGDALCLPYSNKCSALLDPLKVAGIGRLLHVRLRIVFPELRHVGIARDRNVPEFSVGTLHPLADIDVVDRVAVGIELHRPAQRGIGELGGQHRLDQRVAVLALA